MTITSAILIEEYKRYEELIVATMAILENSSGTVLFLEIADLLKEAKFKDERHMVQLIVDIYQRGKATGAQERHGYIQSQAE